MGTELGAKLIDLAIWVVGAGGAAAIARYLALWRQHSQVKSEVKRDRLVDSGMQWNADEHRRQVARLTEELEAVKKISEADRRTVVEMYEDKVQSSARIGALEATLEAYRAQVAQMQAEERRMNALRERLAKQQQRVDSAMDYLRKSNRAGELSDTGWGDLVEE